MNDPIRHGIDAAAAVSVIASIAGWLPPIAALFGIAWYGVLFYDRIKYGPRNK